MAATTMIALAVGGQVYNGIEANQQKQKAKGQAAAILASAPTAAASQQTANTAALTAQAAQRQKAMSTPGYNATIKTGPMGVTPSAPPATKTLLGL